jgi:hypothetical protein
VNKIRTHLSDARFDGGIREIVLHDLIEELMLFVANNNPSTVVELLDECFAIDVVDLAEEPIIVDTTSAGVI